ncbi:MAG TPA: GGDEF domain-containing protein [Bdellovibrionota bacterium]|jgi:diguanylate cyclase (GGDEF)-like protein|nr:GGDEF domain-containing protein [Bdellovibrionota bacterium]
MKSENAEVLAQLLLDKHQLERELRTDDITGLGNLRALRESLAARQGTRYGLLFIDIDYFKQVNEAHGHLAASGVLRDFGVMLGSLAASHGEKAYRYAGDEFVLILEQNLDTLMERAESLRRFVEARLFKVDGHQGKASLRITVSIGGRLSEADEAFEKILSDADKALFEAKRKSRNAAVAYSA